MIIGFDIGGTNMRVAWSPDGMHFEDPIIESTPTSGSQGVDTLISFMRTAARGRPIMAIAGGIAGALAGDKQSLAHSPNLPEWVHIPLVGLLSSAFQVPVRLENDTAVVGLGEALAGAGQGHDIVAYVTISTGVGGARLVHGRIDQSRHGFEPGHHIMDHEHLTTFEQLVSGTSNAKRYQTDITQLPAEAWEQLAKQAAIGLYNTALFWSPDCIVVGGSMIVKKIVIPFDRIQHHYENLPVSFDSMPPLIKANLDSIGGLYGALALGRQLI